VQGKHTLEQIVAKLRQAEVELAKGRTIQQVRERRSKSSALLRFFIGRRSCGSVDAGSVLGR
jgi:hypothetical protein